MKAYDNIYLVGPMGVGKTTVGRQLARSLKLPFYDSDKAIEEKTGVDIPTIFEFEGEEGFRKREARIIEQLIMEKGIVLATGGGAVLQEGNRKVLQQHGFVVYLSCSVDHILERTRKDNQRPLLQTENPRATVGRLIAERDPYYREIADFEINTGILQSREIIKLIIKQYKSCKENN